jgi:predicted dehydrogenase
MAGAAVFATTAKSYANIIGANDRLAVAVMGTRSRGKSLLGDFIRSNSARVTHVCDVDREILDATMDYVASLSAPRPKARADVRFALDDPGLDALVIATPDHWHAAATVMGLKAGKHIYLEKPCGYDPAEGGLLVQAQEKYQRVVQMGNQQRSSPESIALMQAIAAGDLGEPYYAECWYANNRKSIGTGNVVNPPAHLDWGLWQGPAPRRAYADNIVPYNWHWFWHWGTGELCNNAAHELDIARWAMGLGFPSRVDVDGSRRFFADDDWEMYDTMSARFSFEGGKSITWEGHSCNNVLKWGRSRGAMIYGTRGSALVDRSGFTMFDLEGAVIREMLAEEESGDSKDLVGGGLLTSLHVENFLETINGKASTQNSPIDEGHKSTLLCHLGNIAYRTGSVLTCNPADGTIVGNPEASALWRRNYEPGWELEL